MKDLDRAIAERAVARGLLGRSALERCERLVEEQRASGRRAYLAQVFIQEKLLGTKELLELEDEIAAPVYECPNCQQKHAAPDLARPGEKFACKGCGRKVRLLERDRNLTQVEVLASKDPRDLTIPLRLASETGSATQVGEFDLERYQVEGELGRGGYGVVFKARHKDLDRLVALKIVRATPDLDATALERFVREGRAASRLSHPNITQVYDIGRYKDLLALAMELVPGKALRDEIQEGRLPWRRACEVMRGILAGIQHAHENGIIHRDLKPSNVIIEEGTGRPRIIDFGLAKDATSRADLTGAGQILGTPYYLAPEQVEGRSHQVDARSDVFALGTIFYECLTGERPFTAKLRSEVYAQILLKEPVPPRARVPGIPAAVEAACLKALAKKPEARFQSARELASALESALAADVTAEDESSGTRSGRPRKRTTREVRTLSKSAARRVPSEPAVAQASSGGSRGLAPVLVLGAGLALLVGALALRSGSEPGKADDPPRVALEPSPSVEPRRPSPRPSPSPAAAAVAPSPAPSPAEAEAPAPSETSLAPAPSPSPSPDADAPGADAPGPGGSPAPVATPEPAPTPVPAPAGRDAGAVARDEGKDDAREFPSLAEKSEKDWVARAFATNFYAARPSSPANVRALRFALLDRHPLVRAFALRGLTLRTADDLRAWGGHALVEGLVANLRATKEEPYLSKTARVVLASLAGKDLGAREDAWRAWWKETGEAAFEAAARARPEQAPTIAEAQAQVEATTRAREATTYFAQSREQGLECAICLDVTDSMVPNLARVRREITQITSFFSLLLPHKGRLALVTYGDLVKDVVPLTDNMRAFAAEVEGKAVLFHDPADHTVEEGPDKALALCVGEKNVLGWKRDPRKILVVMGDAPMHKEDEVGCFDLVSKAAARGFAVNAVICEPPAKFAQRWPPGPEFKHLAELGGGLAVELKDPKELITHLLVLTLGSKHEDDLRRFVVAYREVTGLGSE